MEILNNIAYLCNVKKEIEKKEKDLKEQLKEALTLCGRRYLTAQR